MKKLFKTFLCAGLAIGLVGCTSTESESQIAKSDTQISESKNQTVKNNESKELIIEESGYFLTDDTTPYIMYSVKLTNPNEEDFVDFAEVNITSYDEEGKILASSTQTWGAIAPGQSVYFAGQADCNEMVPAKVEFKVANTKDDYVESPFADELIELEVSNTNFVPGDFSSRVTGVVKNTMEEDAGSAWVSVIFYKDGVMVGGDHSFSDGISAGGEMPFDIAVYDLPEEYDDYKVYAYNWF